MIVKCFFKNLADKTNDKVKFDITPKTHGEYFSVTYGCIRFIDSYRFLSSSLDSLLRKLVVSYLKTLKSLKKETVDNDEMLNILNEIGEEDRSIQDLKKDYPKEIEKIEEVFFKYIGENDPKLLKSDFPDKWKYLTKKVASPSEFLNCIDIIKKLLII